MTDIAAVEGAFRRQVISRIGFWLGLIIIAVIAPRYLIVSIKPWQICVQVAFAAGLLCIPWLERRRAESWMLSSMLLFCLTGLAILIGFGNAGMRAPGTVILVVNPVIGYFCGGKSMARIALGLSCVGFAVLVLAERFALTAALAAPARYSEYKAMVDLFAAAGVYAIGAAYERSRALSERLLLEVSTRASQAAKLAALGEMAAGIGHEINNPVAIIVGKSRHLQKSIADGSFAPGAALEELQKVEVTAQRISQIIKGLRALARNSENDPKEKIRMAVLLGDTLAFCGERFKSSGVEVVVECDAELVVCCRPSELSQVLLNLLNNSFDAICAQPEKWVRLQAGIAGQSVQISVTDSGPGIAPGVVKKIMEPFFTTKDAGKGTGLGLSISKNIVEAYGGSLRYDAQSRNTRFVILLPND